MTTELSQVEMNGIEREIERAELSPDCSLIVPSRKVVLPPDKARALFELAKIGIESERQRRFDEANQRTQKEHDRRRCEAALLAVASTEGAAK